MKKSENVMNGFENKILDTKVLRSLEFFWANFFPLLSLFQTIYDQWFNYIGTNQMLCKPNRSLYVLVMSRSVSEWIHTLSLPVLARSRREIRSLSDCNWTRTQNHLVHKRTLNHLAKLGQLSVHLRTKWFWVTLHVLVSTLNRLFFLK